MNRHNLRPSADCRPEAPNGRGTFRSTEVEDIRAGASQFLASRPAGWRGSLPAAQRVGWLASRLSCVQTLRALRIC